MGESEVAYEWEGWVVPGDYLHAHAEPTPVDMWEGAWEDGPPPGRDGYKPCKVVVYDDSPPADKPYRVLLWMVAGGVAYIALEWLLLNLFA